MVLAGFWVTADGWFVVKPGVMSSLVTPWPASEDAGIRVDRSSWSTVVTSVDVVAVGCSEEEAGELDDAKFSRTMVKPAVGSVEAEATAVEAGGPSEGLNVPDLSVAACPPVVDRWGRTPPACVASSPESAGGKTVDVSLLNSALVESAFRSRTAGSPSPLMLPGFRVGRGSPAPSGPSPSGGKSVSRTKRQVRMPGHHPHRNL